eukprot:c17969_g3_i1 orf=264-770(+)
MEEDRRNRLLRMNVENNIFPSKYFAIILLIVISETSSRVHGRPGALLVTDHPIIQQGAMERRTSPQIQLHQGATERETLPQIQNLQITGIPTPTIMLRTIQLDLTRDKSPRRKLSGPGSAPPTCISKCGSCTPCKPIRVPIQPGNSAGLTEYYPEAWRCQCGQKLYMP